MRYSNARVGFVIMLDNFHVSMRVSVRWPPLWSRSEFLATGPEVRVPFPTLPDFLKSSGSGKGSTQPREYNLRATWKKSSGSGLENRNTAVGIRYDYNVASSIREKLTLTSPTSGGRSVGIVRSQTHAAEFVFVYLFVSIRYVYFGWRWSSLLGIRPLWNNHDGRTRAWLQHIPNLKWKPPQEQLPYKHILCTWRCPINPEHVVNVYN
jgi:hypothetical protein